MQAKLPPKDEDDKKMSEVFDKAEKVLNQMMTEFTEILAMLRSDEDCLNATIRTPHGVVEVHFMSAPVIEMTLDKYKRADEKYIIPLLNNQ